MKKSMVAETPFAGMAKELTCLSHLPLSALMSHLPTSTKKVVDVSLGCGNQTSTELFPVDTFPGLGLQFHWAVGWSQGRRQLPSCSGMVG